MWEEDIAIRCPACGSILVEENEETELWKCRACHAVFQVDLERLIC